MPASRPQRPSRQQPTPKTRAQVPAPSPKAPVRQPLSLDEFAKTQRPGRHDIQIWFEQHPDVLASIKSGFAKGYSDHMIWKWLRKEHEFPFSVGTVRGVQEGRH